MRKFEKQPYFKHDIMQQPQVSTIGKDDLLCKEYKNKDRILLEYRGFRLPSLKLLIDYLFSGHLLKIERNHSQLQFDIYLRKHSVDTKCEIDMKEIEKFRKYYGLGFHLIILANADYNTAD